MIVVSYRYPNIDEHHVIEQISNEANPSLLQLPTDVDFDGVIAIPTCDISDHNAYQSHDELNVIVTQLW